MAAFKEPTLAETVAGKILIGVAIASISGLLGAIGGWLVARDAPPVAQIVPSKVTTPPDQVVQFIADGSSDPDGDTLSYKWWVGGTAFEESPIARCSAKGALAECRFLSPGTYGVSVEATNQSGLSDSAVAEVSVEIQGGYIGLRVDEDAEQSDELYRALLAAVNWMEVQLHTPRLLMFYDPDRRRMAYASSIRSKDEVDLSVLAGVKVIVPFPRGPAFDAVKSGLNMAGATVVSIPADQVIHALASGAGRVGFIPLSKPDSFCELISAC